MKNLREFLERKYLAQPGDNYSMEQIADDILGQLDVNQENYFDVTGFAKDFYLSPSLTQDKKRSFYKELKTKDFFKRLNNRLYADHFSICSWTIYIIGKFSNNENAFFLETAYETNFSLTNPMLSYRCLNELSWLNSKKVSKYLAGLELENSNTSKLILLYYWESVNNSSQFNQLLADKELLGFISPNQLLLNEEAISDRLLGFENYVSGLYNSTGSNKLDKIEFGNIAKNYFGRYQ
ncbi:hypothetical protein ACTJIJ_04985 [Niabella sp. 22666]|uniref:hypothetical protein n=1 Tax=Niabella sp. 22666 TaxID=3453954 RepID=UPI003F82D0CA